MIKHVIQSTTFITHDGESFPTSVAAKKYLRDKRDGILRDLANAFFNETISDLEKLIPSRLPALRALVRVYDDIKAPIVIEYGDNKEEL